MYHDTIVMPKQPAEAAIKNNTAHKIKTIQIKSYTHAIILSIIYIYIYVMKLMNAQTLSRTFFTQCLGKSI